MKPAKIILIGLGVMMTSSAQSQTTSRSKDARPNIIFIMPDNTARSWLDCYGSQENVTPNLDKLARSGLQFNIFWNMCSCTLSRVALLTGQYPYHTGWNYHWDVPRWGGHYFDWKRETAFPRLLREAGYVTAVVGKWQVNDLRRAPDALSYHGFDEYCVWSGFETGNPPSGEKYWGPYHITNGKRKIFDKATFGPDVRNDFVLDFIEKHKNEPFLLYYPMLLNHSPYVHTPLNKGDTTLKKIALYRDMVKYMDYLIGRMVKRLDELGIRRNTVIMFTTDHSGPAAEHPGNVIWPGGNGSKHDHRRGQTPFIINWPAVIKKGKQTNELASIVDIYPTFLDMAGIHPPDSLLLDGISLLPFIREETDSLHPWIYAQITRENHPLRWIRDKQYLLYSDGRFFDLLNDPYEKYDLSKAKEGKIITEKNKLEELLQSIPPDKEMTGFPLPYKESGKIPPLPPSGNEEN